MSGSVKRARSVGKERNIMRLNPHSLAVRSQLNHYSGEEMAINEDIRRSKSPVTVNVDEIPTFQSKGKVMSTEKPKARKHDFLNVYGTHDQAY